jgi:hypothetical protein
MIGLCGAHRTGKTTLARLYAEKHKIRFVETSVSAIWHELGYDPATTYDFGTRLMIQEEILKRVDFVLSQHAGTEFITDRTPLDMAAYTLADAIGDRVPPTMQKRLAKYVEDCFHSTNRRFGVVLLVQPGIALVDEPGKAPINEGYIEHLNSLILGLTVDERMKPAHFYMPRSLKDIDERMTALEAAMSRAKGRVVGEIGEALKMGMLSVH